MAMAIGSVAAAGVSFQSSCGYRDFESRSGASLKGFPVQLQQFRGLSQATIRRNGAVKAEYRSGSGGGSGDFLTGFLLGGVVFGALGYLIAPQVNKSLTELGKENGALPTKPDKYLEHEGIEEAAGVERTRKSLSAKIDELNAAIEKVSSQLRNESTEIEASV